MSRRNRRHYNSAARNKMRFFYDPTAHSRETQWEMEREYASKADPDKPPPLESGDKYIAIGAVTGIVLGGAAGAATGLLFHLALLTIIFTAVAGLVIGGLIGAAIGSRIKKHRLTPKG
jgi:predicted lipid-binding transport protein (Tim44 family)